MTGIEYERHIARLLTSIGSSVEFTPATGDFGVDLIVNRHIAIQCKRLNKPVGIDAVQQVSSGGRMRGCNTAVVVSNQEYTAAARKLAASLHVVLVSPSNRDELKNICRPNLPPGVYR